MDGASSLAAPAAPATAASSTSTMGGVPGTAAASAVLGTWVTETLRRSTVLDPEFDPLAPASPGAAAPSPLPLAASHVPLLPPPPRSPAPSASPTSPFGLSASASPPMQPSVATGDVPLLPPPPSAAVPRRGLADPGLVSSRRMSSTPPASATREYDPAQVTPSAEVEASPATRTPQGYVRSNLGRFQRQGSMLGPLGSTDPSRDSLHHRDGSTEDTSPMLPQAEAAKRTNGTPKGADVVLSMSLDDHGGSEGEFHAFRRANPLHPWNVQTRWERFKHQTDKLVHSRQFFFAIKETLAFLLCCLLVLIAPVRDALGGAVGTVPVVVIMTRVSGTVGLNLRNGFVLLIGTLIGGVLGYVTVVVGGTNTPALLALLAIFSAIIIFAKSLKVSWQPGANLAVTTYVGIIVSNHSTVTSPGDPLSSVTTSLLGMSTGIAICTLVSIVWFPRSAAAEFDDQMRLALSIISDLVNLSTLRAMNAGDASEAEIDSLQEVAMKARDAVRTLRDMQSEAKWEFGRVFWYFDEHTAINTTLQHMVRLASAMEAKGDPSSSALQAVSPVQMSKLTTTIRNLQQRFRIYAVDLIPVLYDRGRMTQEQQNQIEGLTQLLAEFDEHIKEMVMPLGQEQDVGAVNFKMIAFRELVMELVHLVEGVVEIQTKHKTTRDVFSALAREAVNFTPLVQPEGLAQSVDEKKSQKASLRYRVWRFFSKFDSIQVKYAVKLSAVMTILATTSFIENTSGWFAEWGLDWALIVLVYVSSPTFGGSLNAAMARLSGIGIAAAFTAFAWVIMGYNPVGAFFIIVPYSLFFHYLRLGSRFNFVGIQAISALTAMLLAMYAYGPSNTMTVWELITKRCFSISVGVLSALVVGRLIWPYLARHELRKAISGILQRMSLLYSVLQRHVDSSVAEISSVLSEIRSFEGIIQQMIIECDTLLDASMREPRLKGPLNVAVYKRTLENVQRLLDHLSCLRVLLTRGVSEELLEQLAMNRQLVQAVAFERREQTVDMLLFFYILSAAVVFKSPLPYYLPNVKRAIDRAFRKWRKLVPNADSGPAGAGPLPPAAHFGTALVYAYATNLRDIAGVLEEIGADFKVLFGVNMAVKYGEDFRKLSNVSMPALPALPHG